jgi:hypothetical protein
VEEPPNPLYHEKKQCTSKSILRQDFLKINPKKAQNILSFAALPLREILQT